MKLGIMQPYFLPYIGYFQLIAAVDTFILYDNVKYTKKGWINRNRMYQRGKDAIFSLPLKSASDTLDIGQRELATDFSRDKLLNQFKGAYRSAPYFDQTFSLLEQIMQCENENLFGFIFQSIVMICKRLGIDTEIRVSSKIVIDHDLKGQERVLALCDSLGANVYINAIGGMTLYSKDVFQARGVELKFIKSKPIDYPQLGNNFVPWLSIIDVMMFNHPEMCLRFLGEYELAS